LITETEKNAAAYDRIADEFEKDRRPLSRELPYFERFAALLPPSGRVLDAGCGTGQWMRLLLDRGFAVTGIDASPGMLAFARAQCPGAELLKADMTRIDLAGRFHGIVAWDSVFHVPRALHAALFRSFHGWLEPGGALLLSVGGSEDEFTAPMFGVDFFYSGHAPEVSEQLLRDAGFDVLLREVDDPSSRGHVAIIATRA
jgi:SAM-dependent methyltransferase